MSKKLSYDEKLSARYDALHEFYALTKTAMKWFKGTKRTRAIQKALKETEKKLEKLEWTSK